ncbi:hypothetical protein K438DRAFT_1977039 [Mycena galopus ATCC 62051]|nr:hypothetical protein K438DRAFT_1977039 [Mycena galopus ATCC 62051]
MSHVAIIPADTLKPLRLTPTNKCISEEKGCVILIGVRHSHWARRPWLMGSRWTIRGVAEPANTAKELEYKRLAAAYTKLYGFFFPNEDTGVNNNEDIWAYINLQKAHVFVGRTDGKGCERDWSANCTNTPSMGSTDGEGCEDFWAYINLQKAHTFVGRTDSEGCKCDWPANCTNGLYRYA